MVSEDVFDVVVCGVLASEAVGSYACMEIDS